MEINYGGSASEEHIVRLVTDAAVSIDHINIGIEITKN